MSSILLIGPPGSGKTTALSTVAKLGPTAVIDFDNKLHKMVNLKHLLRTPQNPTGNLIQIAIDDPLSTVGLKRLATTKHEQAGSTTISNPKGYLHFVEVMDEIEKNGTYLGTKLFAVGLDSYTSMQEHLKRLLLAANGKMTMTLPLYGAMLTNLEEINNTFIRLKMHTLILAHERLEKDELTGRVLAKIFVEGQMADKMGKDFEEIYYMTKTISGVGTSTVAKYEMLTVGDTMRSARTSHNIAAVVEPDFSKILK